MTDNKPRPGDRKPYYIAPVIIAVLVAAIGIVTFMELPKPAAPVAPPPKVVAPPKPPLAKPIVAAIEPPPPLSRADLIENARVAASDFARDGKLNPDADPLVGRRFSISIPFGCNGVQSDATASQLSLTYDAAHQTIELIAQPGFWTDLPLVQSISNAGDIEAVEGFWIPRPWTNSQSCPPQIDYPVPATPTPPTAQTLGLARIFAAGGSRVAQHFDRPYTFTRKLTSDDPELLTHSYVLELEGTLNAFADRRALHCWMEAPDHQPLCLYSVTFDRVAFKDGVSGDVLASWTD